MIQTSEFAGFREHLDREWSNLSQLVQTLPGQKLSSKEQAIAGLVKMLLQVFPPPSQLLGTSDEEAHEKIESLIHLLEKVRDGRSVIPGDRTDNGTLN